MGTHRKCLCSLTSFLIFGTYAMNAYSADSGTITFVGQITVPTYAAQVSTAAEARGVTATLAADGSSKARLTFAEMSDGTLARVNVTGLDQTQVVARFLDTEGRTVSPNSSLGYEINNKGGTLLLTARSNGAKAGGHYNVVVDVSYD